MTYEEAINMHLHALVELYEALGHEVAEIRITTSDRPEAPTYYVYKEGWDVDKRIEHFVSTYDPSRGCGKYTNQ